MQQKEVWFWVGLAALYFAFLVGLAALYHAGAGVSQNLVFATIEAEVNEVNVQDSLVEIETALAACKRDYGRYPPAATWLEELNPGSDGGYELEVNTNRITYLTWGPYDPWQNRYQLVYTGQPDAVRIYSLGPDGISETEGNDPDDINNWSPVDTPLASSGGSTNGPVNAPVLGWQESHAQGLQWLAMGLSPIALFWPIGLVWSIARRKHRATLARLEAERLARVHPSEPGG
jgi:general secretion pathway protein G